MEQAEFAFIGGAFIGGLAAMLLRLPPLVGFLAAGFALNYLGFTLTPTLETISNLGVTLLLFTIGLKLDVRTLLRGEVWLGATSHMIISSAILVLLLSLLKLTGIALLVQSDWQTFLLLSFALAFSSTVFAVKVLEERSEMQSFYGRLAIGVLIMQDIFAVLFLSASTGKLPSIWALGLFLLIPLAPFLRRLLNMVGHGEMQILYGVLLALVLGYGLFDFVGVKGDLGALIIGMLLAPHKSSHQLAKSLFHLKEFLLVGFFLSIGLIALPTMELLLLAMLLLLLIPVKSILFLLIFNRFRLRNRTSTLATLSLSNYSEFGLIVAALAVSQGWFHESWLVVLSIAVAMSFVLASPINSASEKVYLYLDKFLPNIPIEKLHPADKPVTISNADAIVLGMGKIGRGAYKRLVQNYDLDVLGIDNNIDKVNEIREQGYQIIHGDASDSDFWDKLVSNQTTQMILLAMPSHYGNVHAMEQLGNRGFDGKITAIVEYADEIEILKSLGVDQVFHVYDEAGMGLADSAIMVAGIRSDS
ncbi:cation:proton antiporter family protein [Ostreibacterium oceani]|uniref:Potassium transporter Kef n=1 Tax=Ostreibacterium oceani TaxID=2654998 RepID=A0A6N7ESV5_9GAMM|nr:cation:proton antiporter family protein [Ostreibacterium oceani]MPV85582.1 potassium transporter Kef [Ostreibacterium oceani]